jgi:hypothetical protein
VSIEILEDSTAVPGIEVWFSRASNGITIIHAIILPLPIGKNGKPEATWMNSKGIKRSTVSKESAEQIREFVANAGRDPAAYIIDADKSYWNDQHCFFASEEDVTKRVAVAYVKERINLSRAARHDGSPERAPT